MSSFPDKSSLRHAIPLVGLVGGVGSGKSTIARELARRFPVEILDADRVGHDVLLREDVKTALRLEFGDGIFDESQEIIRSKLATLVFGAEDQTRRNREKLEQIVHPLIRSDIRQQLQHVRELNQVQAVLLDAPLLLESGWKELCDAVVFIDTPLDRRQEWTRASRNWSNEELARREASQWPIERKRSASDFVVDNSGSLEAAVRQLNQYILELNATMTTP